jgi:hypothetical protein
MKKGVKNLLAQTPLTKEIPQGVPVSKSFSSISPQISSEVGEAMKVLDSIHGDGNLPKLPLKVNNRMKAYGHIRYRRYRYTGNLADISNITIRKKNGTPITTLWHELGHFMDLTVIDGYGEFASAKSPMFAKFRKLVRESKAYKSLDASVVLANARKKGLRIVPKDLREHVAYLKQDHELFARAYSQYIAKKSGNPKYLKELTDKIDTNNIGLLNQWDEIDFKPIFEEIDRILTEEMKWIKKI